MKNPIRWLTLVAVLCALGVGVGGCRHHHPRDDRHPRMHTHQVNPHTPSPQRHHRLPAPPPAPEQNRRPAPPPSR